MTTTETLYKFLGRDRFCIFGRGSWEPVGVWMPSVKGDIVMCENGYHLCQESSLINWVNKELYEAEYEGERLDRSDKIVVRRARLVRRVDTWNERTARLFACDCAERVLPIFEKANPGDGRPRWAIGIARRFANGEATSKELYAARAGANAAATAATDAYTAAYATAATDAANAAYAAANATDAYAARAAADATDAAAAAAYAARAAAFAAGAAAYAYSSRAAREWQTSRLLQYIKGEVA